MESGSNGKGGERKERKERVKESPKNQASHKLWNLHADLFFKKKKPARGQKRRGGGLVGLDPCFDFFVHWIFFSHEGTFWNGIPT